MSSYPTTIVVLAAHSDTTDTIFAADINTPNAEIVAVETGLLNGFQHDLLPLVDDAKSLGSTSKRWLKGWFQDLDLDGTLTAQALSAPGQPRASAYNNTTQSVGSGAFTSLTFNAEDYDVGSMHDTGSNTSRVTVPTGGDGLYLIVGSTRIAAMGAGTQAGVQLLKNGATSLKVVVRPSANATTDYLISDVQVLAATDYIELQGFQDSGGNINFGNVTRNVAACLLLVKLW